MVKASFLAIVLISLFFSGLNEKAYAHRSFGRMNLTYNGSVKGLLVDGKSNQPLAFGSLSLLSAKDSSLVKSTLTDERGRFSFTELPYGQYVLRASFMGYEVKVFPAFAVTANGPFHDLTTLSLTPSPALLKTVVIADKQVIAEQKGDTIQYRANAYKTHPDATAEDLVTKMPGVSSSNGNVTVNGEQVKQVLVDGKPFFGDDPTMALKNLPAEVIEKVQIFDKLSDQAQFTGFDDGQTSKTMNITTKANKSNGEFGKFFAGYGPGGVYLTGGNLNLFKDDRRISIFALSNNVNQQNFAASNTFNVPLQNGITTTNALGINYSDVWFKQVKLTGSAFFNATDNVLDQSVQRNYVGGSTNGKSVGVMGYSEWDSLRNLNSNQRYNVKLEYQLDSANSFVLWPKVNAQTGSSPSQVMGLSPMVSQTSNNTYAYSGGYDFTNTFLWRHKLKKKGRTLSLGINTDLNDALGHGNNNSLTRYLGTVTDSAVVKQMNYTITKGYIVAPNLIYTEPVDSFGQIQLSYNPSITYNNLDKETSNFNKVNGAYSLLDTVLSNKYEGKTVVQKEGIGYRYAKKKWMLMSGINVQTATVSGDEQYPTAFGAQRIYTNLLPSATINYKFTNGNNLRIIYRASTNLPSLSQLQTTINNTNPLLLSTGNGHLVQDYEHTVTIRYGKTNSRRETRSGFFGFLYANYANNYIGNATWMPGKDTLLTNGYDLRKGAQLVKPVNLNGQWNTRSLLSYAIPLSKLKSNLSLNVGANYALTPGLINDNLNYASSTSLTGGGGLSSNISEALDFNLTYSANYTMGRNTLQSQLNTNYYNGTTTFKLNYLYKKRLVFNTSLNQVTISGLGVNLDQHYFIWNAYIAYKFLKTYALEAKLGVNDILNQNQSLSRSISDTYIQDTRTNVLQRYTLFSLTYNLRNFKGMSKFTLPEDQPNERGGDRGGERGGDRGGDRGWNRGGG